MGIWSKADALEITKESSKKNTKAIFFMTAFTGNEKLTFVLIINTA
jgi:hypothetical protein